MFTYQSDNPHLRQVSSPSGFIPLRDDHSLCRTLDAGAPRAIYRRRRGELKSLCHWGQKKLLFSEIEFLSKYVRVAASDSEGLNDRVSACGSGSGKAVRYQYHCLYAGASPGERWPAADLTAEGTRTAPPVTSARNRRRDWCLRMATSQDGGC